MRTLQIMILVATMAVMTAFGGMITDGTHAEEENDAVSVEEVVVEEATVEEETTPTEDVYTEEVVVEENENNDECYKANATVEEIIEADTGLVVDKVKLVDSYGNWAFYEVFADGDIYAVTIKANSVDVCVILN